MDRKTPRIEELNPELRQRMIDEPITESGIKCNLFSNSFIESVVHVTSRTITVNFKNGRKLFILRHPSALYEIIPSGKDYEGSLLDVHDQHEKRWVLPYASEEKVRYYINKIGRMPS